MIIGLNLQPLTPASLVGSSKMVNTTAITAGGLLTYTLTISNSGQVATSYMLTDTLEPSLTFVSATPSMTQTGQQLTATGMISGNTSMTYTIVVRVNANFSGTLNNSATVSGDGQTRTLPAPAVTVAPGLRKIYLPLVLKNG